MSSKQGSNTVHVKYRKIHKGELKYDDKVRRRPPSHSFLGAGLSYLSVPPFCLVSGARDIWGRAEGEVARPERGCEDVLVR